ncbi:U1 small nuclear ribonucleoprotein A [Bienertia sinuspersici]
MILCQVDILKLSQIGKEARSLQCQVHTMGSNSYANLRADYEAEHGKKMGLVEAWERSHMRKDGSFVEGTTTEDFLDDAKAKVESLKLANSSCSSVDVEDEAFHDLMNGGDIPERPQGFGFGVKKSDVYEVRGLLRKEGSKKVKTRCVDFDVNVKKNEVLVKENRELSRKNDEYTKTLKAVVTQFSQILDVVRNGKALVQLIDAAQSALHMAIPEGSRLEPALGEGGGGTGCRLVAVRGGAANAADVIKEIRWRHALISQVSEGRISYGPVPNGPMLVSWVVKDDTSSGDGATTEIEDAPTKSRD